MKLSLPKLGSKINSRGVLKAAAILVWIALAVFGAIHAYFAAVASVDAWAISYVERKSLVEPTVKEVPVIAGSIEDATKQVNEVVDTSIKASLK